jgi:hypothetical protein
VFTEGNKLDFFHSDEIKQLNKQIVELSTALGGAPPRPQQAPPGSNDENADILEVSIGDLLGM